MRFNLGTKTRTFTDILLVQDEKVDLDQMFSTLTANAFGVDELPIFSNRRLPARGACCAGMS